MSRHGEQVQCDLRLIQEVEKHTSLYDHHSKDNKDWKSREHAWSTIGKTLKLSPEVCKNRWKNLRDKYTREKKLLMTEGEESYSYHQWPLLHQMSFLWNFVSHRKLISKAGAVIQPVSKPKKAVEDWEHSEYQGGSDSVEADLLDPTCVLIEQEGSIEQVPEDTPPPRSKLRRLLQTKEEVISEQENLTDSNYQSDSVHSVKMTPLRLDEEEYFCMSLASALRRLPKQQSSLIKIKIMEVLHEVQFGEKV